MCYEEYDDYDHDEDTEVDGGYLEDGDIAWEDAYSQD